MLIVGIGEYIISDNEDESIITHALGSCLAFIIRCPKTKKTGLAHIALPEGSKVQAGSARQDKPGYYADYIIPKLIQEFTHEGGCRKDHLHISLVGGADSRKAKDVFKVGAKNVEKTRQCLNLYGIYPSRVDVGGSITRTVQVFIKDGRIITQKQKMLI